jgi:ABC-type transport system involved in multi-copper enzyme maturation permease subunit
MTGRERPPVRRSRPTILGPVFMVELLRASRRRRLYILRALYALALMGLVAIGVSAMDSRSHYSRANSVKQAALFAERFYTAFGFFQMTVGSLLVAAAASGTLADERQRRTIEFLFATDISNRELVLGKFAVVMLSAVALLASAAPVIGLTQLYGATPLDELARSSITAVSTMAFVASGCLLVSTLSTRPREAMVRAFVAAAFLLLAPLLLIFLMIFRPDLYEWIQSVHEFALDANPVVYWVRSRWPETAMYLPTLPGWEGLGRLVWNQSLLTVIFLSWAVLRVRAVHLNASARPAVRKERSAGRFSWRRLLRPGLDVLPAMLWKEFFHQSTIRGMNRRSMIIAALVDGFLLSVLGWYWLRCYSDRDGILRDGFAESISFLSLAVAWVYLLVAATRAATSMTQERESGNWESLLSTRLSGAEIVVGKTFGAVLALRILLLHVLGFFAMSALFFPETKWHGLRMCLAILAASFLVSAVGVWCSTRAAQSSRAVMKTLAVASLFGGLFLIPLNLSEYFFNIPSSRDVREIARSSLFVESLTWAAFAEGPRSVRWGFRNFDAWGWSGLAVQVAIGLAIMAYAAIRFDRWTGRAPHRASSSARQIAS